MLDKIGNVITWPFRMVGSAFFAVISLSADQIRSVCVWAMCGGIAVLGFTNVWHAYQVDHAVHEVHDHNALVGISTMSIQYNSILQLVMVFGVVIIAAQLSTFKAKIGDLVDVESQVRRATGPQGQRGGKPAPAPTAGDETLELIDEIPS